MHRVKDRTHESDMSIELNGQGDELPPDFPYKGAWILNPRMFLYIPDQPFTGNIATPQFTVELNAGEPGWSFGFDASLVAAAFETTTEAVLAANRSGALTLETVLADTPDGENATLKTYVFSLDGKIANINIKALQNLGNA